MKKTDYNIEFAHIYTNENFTAEHYRATKIALKRIKEVEEEGKSYTVTVLIDNYNPSDHVLKVPEFIKELEIMGVTPDYVIFEADLVNYKDICLNEMNGKIQRQYAKYIGKNDRYPCSFLLAIWHLIRLGALDPEPAIKIKNNKPFPAEKTITILPNRYGSVEKRSIEIIKSTKFADIANRIEYIFFT